MSLTIPALFLLFLGLIFLIWRKWIIRAFRLWIIVFKYGRYSYEFCSFFKDNNLVSPYVTCIKDQIPAHFLVFNRKIEVQNEFLTPIRLDYDGIPFMISSKELISRKGSPDCVNVAMAGGIRFQILGYNDFIDGIRMRSLFIFLQDRFILGEFLFSDIQKVNTSNLVDTISAKYLSGKKIDKDFFYLKDDQGNQLNFEHNGFAISIKYLYKGDPQTNTILSDQSHLFGDHPLDKKLHALKHERLLDRL